jgi:hypothetical protein
VAFRASPIAATVKHPEGFATVVASIQPPTQFLGTAGGDIRQGSFLRGHHQVAVSQTILRSKLTNHIGQFDPPLGSSWEAFAWHMLGLTMLGPPSLEETLGGLPEQLPQILTQRFAQMGIDLGGTDA